jgi:hypothetical protein
MAEASVVETRARVFLSVMPAEKLMLVLILACALGAAAICFGTGRVVNWPPFLTGILATLAMVAIGAYVRGAKGGQRLALATVGVGLFMGFTAAATLFIFALFPLPNPLIDEWLISLDHRLGYDWPTFVTALANYPALSWVLGYVYHSSLPQIVVLTICLAMMARDTQLHRFLLTGILTLVVAIAFWWAFPSVGPSGFQVISDEVRLATGLYFNPEYGAYLRYLVAEGPPVISPEVITGVVAFPSYHMVMACMVVWFSRGTLLFVPALVINALMLPAILSHGGHHLVDVIAGLVVFTLVAWGVSRVIRLQTKA